MYLDRLCGYSQPSIESLSSQAMHKPGEFWSVSQPCLGGQSLSPRSSPGQVHCTIYYSLRLAWSLRKRSFNTSTSASVFAQAKQ